MYSVLLRPLQLDILFHGPMSSIYGSVGRQENVNNSDNGQNRLRSEVNTRVASSQAY